MVVFCAYCGKSFTRKEHLERHIPSHTNVKPHRCSACQLSFARRDLLQRHHSTYHEARDPMDPLPGGIPSVTGRTPIACQNCAQAKTGCDKRVPCARCAEKNLPCAARFARRPTKNAHRLAQALQNQIDAAPQPPQQPPQLQQQPQQQQQPPPPKLSPQPSLLNNFNHLELDPTMQTEPTNLATTTGSTIDPRLHHHQASPMPAKKSHHHHQQHHHQHAGPMKIENDFPSSHTVGPLDDFIHLDFVGSSEPTYGDLLMWPEYQMDIDMYAAAAAPAIHHPQHHHQQQQPQQHQQQHQQRQHSLATSHADNPIPTFAADFSDIASEPLTSSSSRHGSVHTRQTSIVTTAAELDHPVASPGSHPHTQHDQNVLVGGQGLNSPYLPFATTTTAVPTTTGTAPVASHTQDSQNGDNSNVIPEFEAIITAEAAWPLARCTKPIYSGTCPRTALVHLESLEQKSKRDDSWTGLERYIDFEDGSDRQLATGGGLMVEQITQRTRDKMLAITQSFLHKALEIHRGGRGAGSSRYGSPSFGASSGSGPMGAGDHWNFLVLPESKILEYFLGRYVRSPGPYFSLVERGVVDPNQMMRKNEASTLLLVLLMIAQGAAMVPVAEARGMAVGLTETCRINLFDTIEKDVELSADATMGRCALLFTVLGAWSGDKWLMDIAMGQRGMYLSMLKHAGMLETQPPLSAMVDGDATPEIQWQTYLQRERRSRLVYNWVMTDQELSLFHDTTPLLTLSDLQCPLPSPESLWTSPTSEAWLSTLNSMYPSTTSHPPPPSSTSSGATNLSLLSDPVISPSLHDLFQDFLHDEPEMLLNRASSLTPQQLRLLLHPLQAMLVHLREMVSCFGNESLFSANSSSSKSSSSSSNSPGSPPSTAGKKKTQHQTSRDTGKSSMQVRIEEVQALLRRWYDLSLAVEKQQLQQQQKAGGKTGRGKGRKKATKQDVEEGSCEVTRCNLVLYHLISLNAVGNFGEMERIARREGFDITSAKIATPAVTPTAMPSPAPSHSSTSSPKTTAAKTACTSSSSAQLSGISLWDLTLRHKKCLYNREASLFHAGAVLRLVRAMPLHTRPAWWSVAVYRATLVLWVDSLVRVDGGLGQQQAAGNNTAAVVALDTLSEGDVGMKTLLETGDGRPVLTCPVTGKIVGLESPDDVLSYGLGVLAKGVGTRLGDGIGRKLVSLGGAWGWVITSPSSGPSCSSSSLTVAGANMASGGSIMDGVSATGSPAHEVSPVLPDSLLRPAAMGGISGIGMPGGMAGLPPSGPGVTHVNPAAVGLGVMGSVAVAAM